MSQVNTITNLSADSSKSAGYVARFLESFGSVKGMKGVFTIILTAAILAIFELVFFYNIVAPTVKDEMDTNIDKVGDQIAKNLNKSNKSIQEQNPVSDVAVSRATRLVFNDLNKGVLDTLAAREQILVKSINNYTIYTGVVIVLVLSVILYVIWKKIKGSADSGQDEDTDMTDATLSAVITVGVLIAFQILFYFYGKQYRYPGTAGNEELLWVIIDSIKPSEGKAITNTNTNTEVEIEHGVKHESESEQES